MDIKITINCDNATFYEGGEAEDELRSILNRLQEKLGEYHCDSMPEKIMDSNGNAVGKFEVFS